MDTRNCFEGGVGAGTIKYVSGFNHHGKRNSIINKNLCFKECPRYKLKEDWEHTILCDGISETKNELINDMTEEISKEQLGTEEEQQIEMIINDITKYLHKRNNEYNTTQHLIGMKMIF